MSNRWNVLPASVRFTCKVMSIHSFSQIITRTMSLERIQKDSGLAACCHISSSRSINLLISYRRLSDYELIGDICMALWVCTFHFSSVVCQRLYFTVRTKKRVLLRPGIEPGSSACEALVLTDIRTKLCDDVTDVCAVRNDVLFAV